LTLPVPPLALQSAEDENPASVSLIATVTFAGADKPIKATVVDGTNFVWKTNACPGMPLPIHFVDDAMC
jgi:hypothetical protein